MTYNMGDEVYVKGVVYETDNDDADQKGNRYGRQKSYQEVAFPGEGKVNGAVLVVAAAAELVNPASAEDEHLHPGKKEEVLLEEFLPFKIVKQGGNAMERWLWWFR